MLNISAGSYYGNGYSSTSSGSLTRQRSASSTNFRTMSRNVASGYSADIEIIQKYMEKGKVDKALDKYEALFDDIKTTTGNYNYQLTDSEVESILKNAYEAQTGTSLIQTIEKNTNSSFWTGFKESIPIIGFFVNGTSEAEALARLSDDKVDSKDRFLEIAGSLVGTALFAGLTFGLGPIFKGASTLLKGIPTAASALNTAGDFLKGAKTLKTVGTIATGISATSSTCRNVADIEV